MGIITTLSEFGKKLKPFFDLKIKSFEDVVSILLGTVIFVWVIFQAAYMDMTYDEAYTYMNTGRIQDVWKIYQFRIANTHVLNSLLMTVTTLFFPYNDFAIRLPAVLLAGVYISTAISFSKQFKNRLIFLGLLLLFYYFTTYLSMARGYGMSAAFLLASVFVYKNKDKFNQWYLWLAYLFLLAMYANYVAIPIILVMGAYIFVFDFKWKLPEIPKKKLRWIIGLFLLGVYGFFSVTREGKPLYGAYEEGVIEAIPYDFISRFLGRSEMEMAYIIPATFLIVGLIIGFFFISKFKNPIGLITIGTFALIITMAWIGNKPLPTGRVLLPFWPLVVISLMEILDPIMDRLKIPKLVFIVINMGVLGLLIDNFYNQSEYQKRLDTKAVQWRKPLDILANYDREIYPHEVYYLRKDRYHQNFLEQLKEYTSIVLTENEERKVLVYQDLGLVTLSLKDLAEETRIFREIQKGGDVVFSDTISFNHDVYEVEENYPVLIAYPKLEGDLLRVGVIGGGWDERIQLH
ncbi:hypothetical protein KFE94_05490 [bacterium SCSIO 12643]|nr:hypothetical protein KFE94_05490 [bacterium SCSIO 12643]